MISRREVLQRASFVIGYAITGSTAAAVLGGCRVDPRLDWVPRLLTPQQALTVAAMADHLLPPTATPGAADLQVERFIDAALHDYGSDSDQLRFIEGLGEFDAACQTMFEKTFIALTKDERDGIFRHYEQLSPPIAPNIWGGQITDVVEPPVFYRQFKQLALVGYFNSEKVGEELLAYDPIPGRFDPCIPVSSVGKVWSL